MRIRCKHCVMEFSHPVPQRKGETIVRCVSCGSIAGRIIITFVPSEDDMRPVITALF